MLGVTYKTSIARLCRLTAHHTASSGVRIHYTKQFDNQKREESKLLLENGDQLKCCRKLGSQVWPAQGALGGRFYTIRTACRGLLAQPSATRSCVAST